LAGETDVAASASEHNFFNRVAAVPAGLTLAAKDVVAIDAAGKSLLFESFGPIEIIGHPVVLIRLPTHRDCSQGKGVKLC